MYLRKIFMLICCTGCILTAYAKDFLTVHLDNGTKISFAVADRPKITLTDGTFAIGTEHFLLSNIRKYTLGDTNETTAIEESVVSGLSFYPNPTMDYVYIQTDKDIQPRLYSISGMELPVTCKRQEKCIVLDLRNLKSDIYLLQIGKETIKIQKL